MTTFLASETAPYFVVNWNAPFAVAKEIAISTGSGNAGGSAADVNVKFGNLAFLAVLVVVAFVAGAIYCCYCIFHKWSN